MDRQTNLEVPDPKVQERADGRSPRERGERVEAKKQQQRREQDEGMEHQRRRGRSSTHTRVDGQLCPAAQISHWKSDARDCSHRRSKRAAVDGRGASKSGGRELPDRGKLRVSAERDNGAHFELRGGRETKRVLPVKKERAGTRIGQGSAGPGQGSEGRKGRHRSACWIKVVFLSHAPLSFILVFSSLQERDRASHPPKLRLLYVVTGTASRSLRSTVFWELDKTYR
ncbi:unnamed protein product [Calypogeia fissa]